MSMGSKPRDPAESFLLIRCEKLARGQNDAIGDTALNVRFNYNRDMDYFSLSALITPAWILLGFASGFFTERTVSRNWKMAWTVAFVFFALFAWRSTVQQERQRAKRERTMEREQEELRAGQQELNVAFAKLATALKLPPDSPHEMIMERMRAID